MASLGELLAEEQLISAQQLKQALRVAHRSGSPLISVILDQGLVTEEALIEALRRRLDLDLFDPEVTLVESDAVREIPVEQATRYRLLPVNLDRRGGRRILRVAMADPLDVQAVEELEYSTGCSVEPMIARPTQLAEAIRSHYRSAITKIIPRQPRGTETAPASGQAPRRAVFGGTIDPLSLTTRPVKRPSADQQATALRLSALVAVLVKKGLLTQDEIDEQLRQLAPPDEIGE